MNELMNFSSVKTMDSRDIAELCEKEHRKVCRDIEEYLGRLEGGVAKFAHTYQNEQNGQFYKHYKLPYRETMILVSGYNVELRAKVIDRWMELEQKEARKIPATYAEALRLAADQSELIEVLQPKADVYDRISDATGNRLLSEVGKVNGIGPRKIFALCEERGFIFKKRGAWMPRENLQQAGYFVTRDRIAYTDSEGIEHMEIQLYVTPKGELWLAKQLFSLSLIAQ